MEMSPLPRDIKAHVVARTARVLGGGLQQIPTGTPIRHPDLVIRGLAGGLATAVDLVLTFLLAWKFMQHGTTSHSL